MKHAPNSASMFPFFLMFGLEIIPLCHVYLQKCLRCQRQKKPSFAWWLAPHSVIETYVLRVTEKGRDGQIGTTRVVSASESACVTPFDSGVRDFKFPYPLHSTAAPSPCCM